MIELWVKRSGPELKPASPVDFEHFKDLPEGVAIKIKASTGRSSKHLRMFFAAIAKAWFNWPEKHEFQTQHPERLRAWLLCKAGEEFREHLKFKCESPENAKQMQGFFDVFLEHMKTPAITVVSGNIVWVLNPVSISNNNMPDQSDFNKVSQRVSDILEAETGKTLDDYKTEEVT